MSSRAVMILGGGIMQGPAVSAALGLGLEVHLADGDEHCAERDRAHRFHHIDLRDVTGLTACARSIPNLHAVFTAGTDFSHAVARVAEACGLPGTPPDVALACSDKGIMREKLLAAGVPVPRFTVLETEPERPPSGLRLPLVCKPVDNMGSRGVERIQHWEELGRVVAAAIGQSRSRRAILEELIEGEEYSIDGLVVDGTVHVTGLAERHIHLPPYFVELGHSLPADISAESRACIESAFRRAVTALGIRNGAAKGDIFLRNDGDATAVVGEIANRLSGGYMSGWTYPRASGLNLTERALRIALGDPIGPADLEASRDQVAVERALYLPPGRVRSVDDTRARALMAGSDALFLRCGPGDRTVLPRNNVEKVANIITSDPDRATAETRALRVLDALEVDLEPANGPTDAFLFGDGWQGEWARYGISDASLVARLRKHGGTARLPATTQGPVPVWPPSGGTGSLYARVPARPAAEVLEELVQHGVIRWSRAPGLDDSGFWRAFLAAGRHGVRYLEQSLGHKDGSG